MVNANFYFYLLEYLKYFLYLCTLKETNQFKSA